MNRFLRIASLSLALFSLTSHADTLSTKASIALGYDSNAYRAPSADYVDFFADTTGNTTVTPDVQSGFYVPLTLDLTYDKKLNKQWQLIGDYNFDGNFYLDEKLSNADQTSHKAKLGVRYKLINFKKRRSSIYAGAIIGDRNRTYYDRDTGLKKTTGVALDDVSDLYSYSTQGFELIYDYWKKRDYDFYLRYRSEQRDHNSVPNASEYDNQYSRFGAGFDYRFSSAFRFGLDYAHYIYDYDFRHARNLSGQLFGSHPLLQYDYNKTNIVLKHRLSNTLSLKYGYVITTREDNFVGYNDYDKDELSITLRYRPNDQYLLRAKLSSNERNYPRAWNFDRDPGLYPAITDTAHKSSDSTNLLISTDYRLTDETTLFCDIEMEVNSNSDPRYDYDRNRIFAGASWVF